MKKLWIIALLAGLLFPDVQGQNMDEQIRNAVNLEKPNIPGVSGFGQETIGGQRGEIIKVTNLNRLGKGSFGEAIASEGPRIVVFEIAGVIDLEMKSLEIKNPYITIAGQTAPPPGITLIRGGIKIMTQEVIVQHLKVRPGEAGQGKKSGWEVDGIATGQGAHHVILDHCSATWATDENLSASGPRFEGETVGEWRKNTSHHITISQCIIASGLSHSTHGKGEHSKGTLIHDNATNILVYGNLYAHNVDRNPYCKGGSQTAIVNNYIFNPGRGVINYGLVPSEWEGQNPVRGAMSVVGNFVEYGTDSRKGISVFKNRGGELDVFWKDNTGNPDSSGLLIEGLANFVTQPPLWPVGLKPIPSQNVKEWVLENAGAFPWDRDVVDQAVIDGIRTGKGRIIDSEEEAGGYPEFEPEYRKLSPSVINK